MPAFRHSHYTCIVKHCVNIITFVTMCPPFNFKGINDHTANTLNMQRDAEFAVLALKLHAVISAQPLVMKWT